MGALHGITEQQRGAVYTTASDEKEDNRGLGCTTLAKVAFFFTHQANDWRKGNNEIIPPGEFTVWPG